MPNLKRTTNALWLERARQALNTARQSDNALTRSQFLHVARYYQSLALAQGCGDAAPADNAA